MNKHKLVTFLHANRRYVALAMVDIAFFGLISPNSSAFVIIPAFILVVLSIFVILTLIVAYVGKMFVVKPKNQKRIVFMSTATLGIIIALQSIGQLTVRDVATIVPLILVLYLYMSYTKSHRT
jgi:hypothetical protein